MNVKHMVVVGSLIAGMGLGCNKSADKANPVTAPESNTSDGVEAHGEWWCGEHGVPEEVCAQCNTTLAADFKAKGDWCQEHDRPDSQCFICHPEKEVEFAALYEAKYGKKPPKPHAEGDTHDHHEDENKS